MLTPASDDAKELTQLCQGRFTGDPSHEFEVTKYNITNEDTEEENIEEYKVLQRNSIEISYLKFFCLVSIT
jgi:hypothetical protein